jgi:hypothetical protein
MPFYFYNQEYQSLPTWNTIFAGKILQRSDKEVLKINLINSHHLEYKSDQNTSFTEILAESIPMSILQNCLEFELEPDLKMEGENFKIHTTKYTEKDVDKFLKNKNVLFYSQNGENWSVVKYELNQEQSKFWSLNTFKEKGLSLWSESFYRI